MLILSPKNLHYPITVTELLCKPNDTVQRTQPLFSYYYKSFVEEGDQYGDVKRVERSFPTRFESRAEGKIVRWKVTKGSVIAGPDIALVEIDEPCKHEVQFGGMCAVCGKDMTETDYVSPVTKEATVAMAHTTMELKISKEYASRLEEEGQKRLLKARKLHLVVDLDLTVLQATVDPTVAEWREDQNHPNHHAVKDVRSFELAEADGQGRIKRKAWYHIKLRPGLQQFLETISQLYELHIYTMGTRGYAMEIARIIDPDRKLFGDRILSRDENGALHAKSLERLFPTDTRMVVIIDDRVDVWNWSDNQIKVKPFDFFVGIGDINSRFLPKLESIPEKADKSSATATAVQPSANGNGHASAVAAARENDAASDSAIARLLTMSEETDLAQKDAEQDEAINAQIDDRPLLKMQKAQEEAAQNSADDEDDAGSAKRKNLLEDDDRELLRLQEILQDIHRLFYRESDRLHTSYGGRVSELKGTSSAKKPIELIPDVSEVMIDMKNVIFAGVKAVFSGVIPQRTEAQKTDLGYWMVKFGAVIGTEITGATTHLITKPDTLTSKVKQALRRRRVKLVSERWVFDSVDQWKRLPEEPYIIQYDLERVFGKEDSTPLPDDSESEASNTTDDPDVDEAEPDDDDDASTPGIDAADVDAMTKEEWQAMMKEMDEISEDDEAAIDEDDDDEEKSEKSASSTSEFTDHRKREREDEEEDVGSSQGGSALERRKRQALARASSLAKVEHVDADEEVEAEEEDDGFDAAFEAEMAAELAAADD